MIVNKLAIPSQLYPREVQSTHSGSSLCVLMQRGPDITPCQQIETLVKNLMVCIIPVILEGRSCRQKLESIAMYMKPFFL